MDIVTKNIWEQITSQPKWYAGIKTTAGTFYSAQGAGDLKRRFEKGTLSLDIIETIFEAHGYVLVKQWHKKSEGWT